MILLTPVSPGSAVVLLHREEGRIVHIDFFSLIPVKNYDRT